MNKPSLRSPIFIAGHLRAIELDADDIPALQQFFEANPAYFIAVSGAPARSNEAHEEFHEDLPAGWPYTKRWLIGFFNDSDDSGAMIAMAGVVSDLLAKNVWHIGLFVVATALHGSGTAGAIYQSLEAWMVANGAKWLRLGVVQGNARAERFWEKLGYREMRTRSGVQIGSKVNTLRAMAKLPAGSNVEEYLTLIPRDRPGAS